MSEINKDELYGRYQKQEDRRNDLAMKAAHKALDIPQDDMQINANKTVYNSSPVLPTLLAVGLLASGLAGGWLIGNGLRAPSPTTPAATSPADELEAIYEEQQPDGSWKEIRREKIKP